jgi:hypothetical protein
MIEGQSQPLGDGTQDNNAAVVIILSAIGVYLLFRKSKKKEDDKLSFDSIDSYSKFKKTKMGRNIDNQINDLGIDLSANQIMLIDECLQGLSKEEMRILTKASGFSQKSDIRKVLSDEEMRVFVPLRKKILDCLDDTINR